MVRPDVVPAEVALTTGADSAEVARKLADHGLEVVSVGTSSVSVQAAPRQIETVFDTELTSADPPPPGAFDFGPVGSRASYRATRPLRVPADLADQVETVDVVEPPRMMF